MRSTTQSRRRLLRVPILLLVLLLVDQATCFTLHSTAIQGALAIMDNNHHSARATVRPDDDDDDDGYWHDRRRHYRGDGGGGGGGRRLTAMHAKQLPHQDDDDEIDNGTVLATTTTTSTTSQEAAWLLRLCIPLWLVYVSNQWSRSSLYYLVDFSQNAKPYTAMNVALDFNQAQYGVLASVAFTALFAIASLGAGVASDRFNRKSMTIVSALCWSLATLGTAFSTSYTQVILCRIAMGLACAFSTPTAYTLIRDRVPSANQAFASSLYGTGVAVASALAALTILLDTEFGWNNALIIVSAFGFATAVICGLLLGDDPKEDKEENLNAVLVARESSSRRQEEEGKESSSSKNNNNNNIIDSNTILADVMEVVATRRVQWIFLGSFLRFCSGLCIGVWGAPYFRMVFINQQSEYAVAQAAISAIGASLSGLLGGATADWLATNAATAKAKTNNDNSNDLDLTSNKIDAVGRRLWVPVVGSILAAPTWYFAVHSEQSFEIAMAWLAAEYFVAECWFGPTISTLQTTVGPRIGGTAQGLFTVTGAIANIAPSVLGFLYGQVTSSSGAGSSSMELANLLALGVGFGYLSSAACFAIAAQSTPPPPSSPTAFEKAKST